MIELWPNQIKGAGYLKSKDACALWFSPRCGKTLAAISGTDDGDRLVVCPNSVKYVWKGDLNIYGQDSYIWGDKPFPLSRPRNVIINYEMLWRTWLLSWNWDNIIFDESQRLQSLSTKLWSEYNPKSIIKNMDSIRAASRVICLSGTPCPEGYKQLIPQAVVATGQYCGVRDPWEALRTFYTYDADKFEWIINPGHEAQAKKQLHEMGPSMTQEEAGIHTKKLYRVVKVPLGQEEKTMARAMEVENKLILNSDTGIWHCDENMATAIMHAQSIASGRSIDGVIKSSSKLDAVVEFVQEASGQCVIFTWFRESLQYLYKKLPEAGIIEGGDAGAKYRADLLQDFSKGYIKNIIVNEIAGKVGINLSAASYIIFAENAYSGEARIQAEERSTVKGKDIVEIIDFVSVGEGMAGAIDERILEVVRAKKDFNFRCLKNKSAINQK